MKTVTACVAIASLVLAAAMASPARSESGLRSFSLLEVNGGQHGLNGFHFQRAPRAGDQIAQTDRLYKWAGGKRGPKVGHAEMLITSKTDMTRNGAIGLLVAQVFLPAGSLFVEGYARFGGADTPASFPVLGGTGTYSAVRGWVISHPLVGDRTRLDFYLSP